MKEEVTRKPRRGDIRGELVAFDATMRRNYEVFGEFWQLRKQLVLGKIADFFGASCSLIYV